MIWSTISNKNVAKLNRTLSQRNNNGFVQMNDTLFLTFLLTYNSSYRNYLLPRWILFSRVNNLQQYHCAKRSFASSWETSASRERKTWPTLPEYGWAHWIDAIKRIFLRVQEPILHFNDQWGPSGIISFFVKEKKALKLLLSSRKILFYLTNCKKCHLEFFAGFFFHLPLIKSFLLDNCKKRWHCLFHQR